METLLKEVSIEVSRSDSAKRSVDIFVFNGAGKIGRYQVRTNVDGSRDVYHSDIDGGSFNNTRKVQRALSADQFADEAAATIADDLKRRGFVAPALRELSLALPE